MPPRIVLATAADQPDITPSDQLYAEALRRRGATVQGAPWNGASSAFDGADAVILRSTWGYYREPDAFRAWTETIAAKTRLFNPIALVRWNLRKDYLDKLVAGGVRVPRSHLVPATTAEVAAVFRERGWQRAVVKPATGASGYFVDLVAPDEVAALLARLPDEVRSTGVLVQEFLPEIADGELSLVYFDGGFSHAVRKRPPPGEFRVNSRFGATRSRETPAPGVVAQGAAALESLPERPLYARVDGVVREGTLIVLELEVLEPALFMEFAPDSAERFAEATLKRLSSQSGDLLSGGVPPTESALSSRA
ncbi:MAG: glutathione synthetase [Alphaproteobacteria bacterium]|nr:glutathione synthetase [Alphaproteobacteria bacterium]